MDQHLNQLHLALQKLIGLHRRLLETVRIERGALVQANVKEIQEATLAKQALIEAIQLAENERMRPIGFLALEWKKSIKDLTLSNIIMEIQGRDPKRAETLRSEHNTLTILLQHIRDQNSDNQEFVEKSLHHVRTMARNVLGENVPKANTYTHQGSRSNPTQGARLISKEA